VDLLYATRVEEAEAMLARLPTETRGHGLATAHLLFHRGAYEEAAAALASDPSPPPALASRLEWLPGRIDAAGRATAGMVEETRGNFRYRHEPGLDSLLLEYAGEALEGERAALRELLGVAPREPTLVEFFSDTRSFVQASGLPGEWVETTGTVAICKWDRMLVLSPRNMPQGYPWLDTLAHEYVHLALSRASHNKAPVWFQEGSAKLLEGAWRGASRKGFVGPYAESLLAKAIRDDLLISFEAMHPSMAALPSADEAALAFAQVAYAVDYIFDSAGDEGYRRIVEQTATHRDVLRTIDHVLGAAGGRFESRYTSYIARQDLRIRTNVTGFEPSLRDNSATETDEDGEALDPILVSDREMRDLTRIGDMLRLRGHLAAASIEYERAAEAGAFHSPALANKRARALRGLSRSAEAREVLAESVSLYPEYTPTVTLLAELAAEAGDDRLAIELSRRSIGLNPFDPNVHGILARLYERASRSEEAATEREVLELLETGARPRHTTETP